MILVSSCLAGLKVRYNGTHSLHQVIQQMVEDHKAVTICPELLGGFVTPREPAEIVGGNGEDVLNGRAKVIEKSGRDVSEMYIKGAYKTLEKAREIGVSLVVLKEYSPSCGSAMIYNGAFENHKILGHGVTTALLTREGFAVVSEGTFLEMLEHQEDSFLTGL